MKTYRIAFSPCPNDTFMFEAWVNKRLSNAPLVNFQLFDIEQLNELSCSEFAPDLIKMSCVNLPRTKGRYELISAGAALGRSVGPIVVSQGSGWKQKQAHELKIAIPGQHTTATALLSAFHPDWTGTEERVFSTIEDAVLEGQADLGLLIHEGRFTYAQKGLDLVEDLGKTWEQSCGLPLPLGIIAVRSSLNEIEKRTLERSMRASIEFAMAHPDVSAPFVSAYADEMSAEVQKAHIQLYVNQFSIDLGEEGRQAIAELLTRTEGKSSRMVNRNFNE